MSQQCIGWKESAARARAEQKKKDCAEKDLIKMGHIKTATFLEI